jgi:hypothetical protein
MKFEVQFVNSTAIRLIAYSENTLRILFRSGLAYDYTNVNRQVFEELCAAESVGAEFQKIRNAYPYTRISIKDSQDFLICVVKQATQDRLLIEV